MKKYSSIFTVCALLVLVLTACGTVCPTAVSTDTAQMRTLDASGQGEVYLTPDLAYIYVGVQSQADDVSTALNDNNAQANAVSQALQDLGVEAKDIQTTNFNVYPMQDYGPDGTVSRSYYVVDNTIYITVRDLSKLGTLLDSVVKSGANNINGISFDVEDREAAMAEARDKAIADAMAEAESIAQASGVKLGDIQNIYVYSDNTPTTVYEAKGGMTAASDSSVPVSAGQLVITASASLIYEIN